MIRSMTGFAALTRDLGSATMAVSVRSVNHRFLDLQLRAPQSLSELEPKLRALVQRHVSRGRVEMTLALQSRLEPAVDVLLNERVIGALAAAVEAARERGLVSGSLSAGDLLRVPQALVIREVVPDGERTTVDQFGGDVLAAVAQVLGDMDAMRDHEGAHLRVELDGRCVLMRELVDQIAREAELGRAVVEARLTERVRELVRELPVDGSLVAQEIVRMAARSDITEEMVRFRGHLDHWQTLASSPEPCGRKLDFLLQEMGREANTMGAKADGAGMSALIVSLKAELEKTREQVQNVE